MREFGVGLVERLCGSFGVLKPVLSFGGGEPLMNPRATEMIRLAKSKRFVCTLTTNGTFLARHAEGLIAMSACLGGEIPKALEADDWELARHLAGEYRDIMGPDAFYLELMDHGLPEQLAMNPKLLRLARFL